LKIASIERKLKDPTDNDHPSAIDCQSLESFVIDFLDDKLPEQTRLLFLKHIEECDHCDKYLQHYRQTIDLSKAALTENKLSETDKIPEELVEAILTASRKT